MGIKTLFILSLLLIHSKANDNLIPENTSQIKWISFEEAVQLTKQNPKRILLDVYSEGCGWCKKMDTLTFNQPFIASYIKEQFYPVRLDAHSKEEIKYNEKVYKYHKSGRGGYHELAAEILKGRMSYPTVVFLDEEFNVIQSIIGFKTPEQFEVIATYFATDQFMTIPWSAYKAKYTSVLSDK